MPRARRGLARLPAPNPADTYREAAVEVTPIVGDLAELIRLPHDATVKSQDEGD